MSEPIETSVVIIGGSIVGLANALFLAQRRVPFILLERHTGSAIHPRAIGYTTRTIETLRTLGLDQELPKLPPGTGGKPRRVKTKALNSDWVEETHWTKPTDQGAGQTGTRGKPAGAPKGGPPDYASISPVQATAIAQDKLEPIIRNKALELGADLRLGTKMIEWSQDADGVSVTAVNSTGELFTIKAKYLVACDGAASRIRKDLGITTTGVGYMRTLHSILFRCPSIDHYLSKGIHQWELKNDDFEGFLVTYSDGRWALMNYNPQQETMDTEGQKAQIRTAIGENVSDIEILAHGNWALSGSIAEKFSQGRVFLAGDAAHALPPNRGGYGANTGIADAHNLAWKLEAVISGKSDASLLDTYEQERRPVALVRHDQIFSRGDYKPYVVDTEWAKTHDTVPIIDDIAMELGQIYRSSGIIGSQDKNLPDAQTPAQWKGQPGTRAPHVKLMRNGEEISSLDLFCRGWMVLSRNESWSAHSTTVSDVEFVLIGGDITELDDGSFIDAFGLQETGAVLIRPDGYIAARWESVASVDEFCEAFRSVSYQY